MSKVLKTGDVKRYRLTDNCYPGDPWAVVSDDYVETHQKRVWARDEKSLWFRGEPARIARVLSIGPKLVTVRIEK